MKKIYILVSALALFTFTSSAQVVESQPSGTLKFDRPLEKIDYTRPEDTNLKNKEGRSGWYSPVSLMEIKGASFSGISFGRLFPDSTVFIQFTDGINNPPFHMIGNSFDPTDPLYSVQNEEGYEINRFDTYNIDSVRFTYAYVRETDSIDNPNGMGKIEVVDTAFVYFLDPGDMRRFAFRDEALGGFGVPTGLDEDALAPSNFAHVDTILLTADLATETERDGEGISLARLVVGIPEEVSFVRYNVTDFGGAAVSAILAYKPGIPYSFGDTIISFDDNIKAPIQFNDFGTALYTNTGSDINHLVSYNNGIVCNTQVRYGQEINGVDGFLPWTSNFGWNSDVFADFDFFLSEPDGEAWGSVSKFENTLRTKIYPNPSTPNSSVIVDIEDVRSTEDVEITIIDLIGNVIETSSSALSSSQFSVSTEGMTTGIYLVNVTNGSKTSSTKLIIK